MTNGALVQGQSPGRSGGCPEAWGLRTILRLIAVIGSLLVCGGAWGPLAVAKTSSGFHRLEYRVSSAVAAQPESLMREDGWLPFEGILALGYKDQAVWIRAWPDQHGGYRKQDHFLRVGMPYLDDVRLFLKSANGTWTEVIQGDSLPLVNRSPWDRLFLFKMPAQLDPPLLLRVSSTSTLSISVDHLTEEELQQAVLLEHVVLGGLLGLWSILLLWSASNAWVYRDPVAAWFSLYQLSTMLMGIALGGYSALVLPPTFTHISALTSASVLLASIPAVMFHRSLALELKVSRRLIRVLEGVAVLALVNPIVAVAGAERLALQMNAGMIVLALGLYLPAMFLLSLRADGGHRKAVLIAYFILGLFVLFSMLPVLGLGQVGPVGLYSTVLHSVLTGILLGSVLFVRHASVVRQSEYHQRRAEATALENLIIRAERDDKERLLSMLAHELRTPLSVIRMALESPNQTSTAELSGSEQRLKTHARLAVRDMNEVIDRTVQADRVERGLVLLQPTLCHAGELVQLIAGELENPGRLEIQEDPDLPVVESDALLLKTVIGNLVDNAMKYSPAGTPIRVILEGVKADQRYRGLRIEVQNTIGTAGAPHPQRVFEKYYRSEGAQRATGSGLGLYLVKGLVARMGGTVELLPTLGDMVSFEVRLPQRLPN